MLLFTVGNIGLLILISCKALLQLSVIYAISQSINISVGVLRNGETHQPSIILQAAIGNKGLVISTTCIAAL